MNAETAGKLAQLRTAIKQLDSVIIAFSGGVDSSLLIKIAHEELGDKAVALTAKSSALATSELNDAIKLAKEIGIQHVILEYQETEDPHYAANPVNRCYYCKNMLYTKCREYADKHGIKNIVNGLNADDLKDTRYGQQAAKEKGVLGIMADLGITKQQIRDMSKELGLFTWNKAEMACLSSRIPTGSPVTLQKLGTIEQAEAYIKQFGVKQLRVRHHDDIARIQVEKAEMPKLLQHHDKITSHLKTLGYKHVTLDLQAYARP